MAATNDVSAIFFINNQEDTLIIDLEQVFDVNLYQGTSAQVVDVSLNIELDSADFNESNVDFLENYVLVNSFHIQYDEENSSFETIRTKQIEFTDEATEMQPNYGNESLIYTVKLLKPIDKDLKIYLDFGVKVTGSLNHYKAILYLDDNMSSKQKLYKDSGNCIDTDSASFMLAYTNPKLTGNVKLVVDSNYKLYLDTFKSTKLLCNNNYRHQPISYEGNYAHDVYTIFNTLPKGEMYKVNSDAYDPHKVYTNYDDQYWTMYQYGAETNDDFLYSENMKILAPLYIKKSLPDFFAIFRVDEYYNEESYSSSLNDYDKFEQLLKDGKIIKLFDLRKFTSIGQYLNNWAEQISDISSPIFLQFQEQDRDESNVKTKYKNGTNIWTGISLDKGIVVNKSETTYFSNKILSENQYIQDDFNMFLIDGFQRNNILYPNIINLEFMFNDEEAETYSMHKYFGLYLKENTIQKFSGVMKQGILNTNYKIFDSDQKEDNTIKDFIQNVTTSDKYGDRLIFCVTPTNAKRITTYEDFTDFISEEVSNKPYTNEINIEGSKVLKEDEGYESFISMRFVEPIKYGEHFRFVIKHHFDSTTKTYKNVILELIASNDERLANTQSNINPYILANHAYGNGFVITSGYMFRTKQELNSESGYYDDDHNYVTPLLKDSEYYHGYDEEEKNDYSYTNLVIGGDDNVFANLNDDTYYSSATIDHSDIYLGTLNVNIFGLSKELKDEYPEIYRISFYTQDLNDHSQPASINEQLKRIRACIRKFDFAIYTGDIHEDRISFVTSESDVYFQHISADILDANIQHTGDSIDYEKVYPEENIHYFNNAISFRYKPLSFDTKYYSNDALIFAPFDFEILGNRLGTIIKFAEFLPNQYEIDSSVVADKTYPQLLALTNNGYNQINEYSVKSIYPVVDNDYYGNSERTNYVDDNGSVQLNVVMSPFNTLKAMVSSKFPMVFTHYVKLWNISPFNISLMGIHNFKAIDSKVNYSSSKTVSSQRYITASVGNKLLLDGTVGNLQKYTLYKFVSGKFENCALSQGDVFYITSNNEIVYLNDDKLQIEHIAADYLFVYEDVQIENVVDKNYPKYDFTANYPAFNNVAFYKDPSDTQNSDLKTPLAVPVISQISADAVYYDSNNILDVKYVKDKNYQSYLSDSSAAANIGFFNTKENNLADTLDSTVSVSGNLWTFRDVITEKLVDNAIRNFLLYSNNLQSCKAKYNKYTNTLEFIYYGIKFVFTFQNTDYASSIKLNEYNNYEVYMINEYDKTKNNEIFISTIENIILVVNHKFKMTKDENSKSNIIIERSNALSNTIPYTWDTLPYNLDFSEVIANSKYLMLNKINKTDNFCLLNETLSSVIELDYLNPDKEEYDINYYAYFPVGKIIENSAALGKSQDSIIDEEKYVKLKYFDSSSFSSCVNLCTVTENKVESYDSITINSDIEPLVVNTNASIYFDDNNKYDSINTYYVVKNKSSEKTLIDNLFQSYEDSMSGDCNLYIISQKETVVENINESYKPLTFSFITPNKIKFNYGYFDICCEKLLDFEQTDEIDSNIYKQFILANTKLKSVGALKNVVGNKVFNKVLSSEIKSNYFIEPTKSLVASSWDKGYYRLYNNTGNYTSTDGYMTGIEDKSYFGSKCIVLNNEYLDITKWNYTSDVIKLNYGDSNYNTHAENKDTLILSINLTKAVYDYFSKDCEPFIANWKKINSGFSSVYLNNFIKLTLMKYFKLDDSNSFELYQFTNSAYSNDAAIIYDMPEDFSKNWQKVDNFKSEYVNNNDEIVLNIYVSDYKNKTFYPRYTLSRNK